MDEKDIQIITQLRQDARMPLTLMSRKTRIPISTIFDRLKVNQGGLILRHTCLLDFAKLGYSVRANIILKVDKDDRETVRDFLVKYHTINSVYRINNGFDFMVEAVFKEIKEMEDFVAMLEKKFSIKDSKSFFIVEDLKREQFMSDPNLVFGEVKSG